MFKGRICYECMLACPFGANKRGNRARSRFRPSRAAPKDIDPEPDALSVVNAMETSQDRANGKPSATFEPRNVDELSHFFEVNKDKYHEIWVVLTKKKYANPQPVSAYEALTEAIRHGLIDSRTKSVGERKYKMRFAKRAQGSHWSEVNLRILEKIRKEQDGM